MILDERPMERAAGWSKGRTPPMSPPGMALDPLTTTSLPAMPAPSAVPVPRPAPAVAGEPAQVAARAVIPREDETPGPDALAAVQVAAEAYEVLRAKQRELRFEPTEDGILKISIYDGAGRLLGTIPPTEALALASGEASWQA